MAGSGIMEKSSFHHTVISLIQFISVLTFPAKKPENFAKPASPKVKLQVKPPPRNDGRSRRRTPALVTVMIWQNATLFRTQTQHRQQLSIRDFKKEAANLIGARAPTSWKFFKRKPSSSSSTTTCFMFCTTSFQLYELQLSSFVLPLYYHFSSLFRFQLFSSLLHFVECCYLFANCFFSFLLFFCLN